jgi:hypothetical protein
MGFSMFVTDLGALWLARGQAQNAADAGALAGAVARAFDDTGSPPTANGIVYQSALSAVGNHSVVGAAPTADVTMTCPPYATAGARCVRVDVFRDGTHNSVELPSYFGNIFGFTTQKIKATATAWVGTANGTDCLRPFAVPDLFTDLNPGNADNPVGQYHHYYTSGRNAGMPLPNPDTYVKPTSTDPGTGYTIANNYGQPITLKYGNPSQSDVMQPGWFMPIDVPRADGTPTTGGARYSSNISNCNGIPVDVGDYLLTENGGMQGPTQHGLEDLFAKDPYAMWDTSTKRVVGSCAPGCTPPVSFSPRIIALAVYDVEQYDQSMSNNSWTQCPGGGKCVQIVNFLAFFVDHIAQNGDVVGYLTREAGILTTTGGTQLNNQNAFLNVIQLIQ